MNTFLIIIFIFFILFLVIKKFIYLPIKHTMLRRTYKKENLILIINKKYNTIKENPIIKKYPYLKEHIERIIYLTNKYLRTEEFYSNTFKLDTLNRACPEKNIDFIKKEIVKVLDNKEQEIISILDDIIDLNLLILKSRKPIKYIKLISKKFVLIKVIPKLIKILNNFDKFLRKEIVKVESYNKDTIYKELNQNILIEKLLIK
ncbi:hypothetical protein [uncultured Tyzzerella sp.]|uniref:hypothetical protein n=1 Tax=uncultured Tyzzerella sp. TaxID=2321398 RepID=UPI00294313D5|nr:hypothetical protein [uncultured Tyzzerella sp.]